MSSELKPCPFCGGSANFTTNDLFGFVICQGKCNGKVGSTAGWRDSAGPRLETAARMWNSRPIEDDLRERLARAVSTLEFYADRNHWTIDWLEGSHGDYGDRAREFLKAYREGSGE